MGKSDARMRLGWTVRLLVAAILVFSAVPAQAATVLSYHGFDHSGLKTSITPEVFEEHLKFLTQNGYNVVSLEELAGYIDRREPFPPRTVAITIDDGWRSLMRGFALLQKYDLPFTLFLPMEYVANPASKRTLSMADVEALRAYPKASFADHSYSHSKRLMSPRIKRGATSTSFIEKDIAKSRQRYRQVFGGETRFFAYPFGRRAKTYQTLLNEAGFEYLFVVGGSSFDEQVDKNAIPRLGGNQLGVGRLEKLIR